MKKLLVIIFLIPVFIFSARETFAHATPVVYEPEASSLLEKMPEKIRIQFSEHVEKNASGIFVYGPDGSLADFGKAAVDQNDAHFFSILAKDEGVGTYAVSWQVVSADDGHFTKGAFVFSVGKETLIAGIEGSDAGFNVIHSSTLAEGTTLWLELLGQAILIGALISLFFRRKLHYFFAAEPSWALHGFRSRLMIAVLFGTFFVVTGTLSYLFLQSNNLAQIQNIDFISALKLFGGTIAGSYALYRAVIALVFLTIFLAIRKKIFERDSFSRGEAILYFSLFLMLFLRSRVSHAAASHFYPFFSVMVNFVHLAFKDAWVGSLIVLGYSFFPLLKGLEKAVPFFNNLLSRFLSIAFGIVGVTGVYIIWLHLKDPLNVTTTDWGSKFIPLSMLAFALVLLRLFHQLIIEKSGKIGGWFRYSYPLETIFGILILFFSSLLIITTPPLQQTHFVKKEINRGTSITIAEHQEKHLLISVNDEKTRLPVADIKDVVVTIFQEEKGIGPIVVKSEKAADGEYIIPTQSFAPAGIWRIEITAQRTNAYDANAAFKIDYPKELQPRLSDERKFDSFAMLMIIGAIGIFILSFFLYRISCSVNPETALIPLLPDLRHWIISLAIVSAFGFWGWSVYRGFSGDQGCVSSRHQNGHQDMVPCK